MEIKYPQVGICGLSCLLCPFLREELLKQMLETFNEGRSKSYYCIAATVMEIQELRGAVLGASRDSMGLDVKNKSKILHNALDKIAENKNYYLKLRK